MERGDGISVAREVGLRVCVRVGWRVGSRVSSG